MSQTRSLINRYICGLCDVGTFEVFGRHKATALGGSEHQTIIYLIILLRGIMVYSATESYNSQTLSFASLRKCMVDFWFILLQNRAIPYHYFRLANQFIVYDTVYMYSISFARRA